MIKFTVAYVAASILFGVVFAQSEEPQNQKPMPDKPLEMGAKMPAVSAKNQDGIDVDFVQISSDSKLLVYFYPKADTPGCTKQACSLRDAYEPLREAGVAVVGVSQDTVEDQKAFAQKFRLPLVLIADVDGNVARSFGVPDLREGFSARQAFLFSEGKVVWRDLTASTAQQAADVLAALEVSR